MPTDMTTTTHDTAWEAHCARMQRGVYGPQERIKKLRAFVSKYGVLLASSFIAVPPCNRFCILEDHFTSLRYLWHLLKSLRLTTSS